jgi:hypothetical protein
MNEILEKTLNLVYSSKRRMPAHFNCWKERTQSFGIDFEPLNIEADYNMASEVYNSSFSELPDTKIKLSESERDAVRVCGENIMVGTFILAKLGGNNMIGEMRKIIIDTAISNFESQIKNIKNVLSFDAVSEFFDHCIEYSLSVHDGWSK